MPFLREQRLGGRGAPEKSRAQAEEQGKVGSMEFYAGRASQDFTPHLRTFTPRFPQLRHGLDQFRCDNFNHCTNLEHNDGSSSHPFQRVRGESPLYGTAGPNRIRSPSMRNGSG